MTTYKYTATAEDPTIYGEWITGLGAVKDLSAGTFELWLVERANPSILAYTKSSGITGYATAQGSAPYTYNWLVQWSSGELATALAAGSGNYTALLKHTLSGRLSQFPGDLEVIIEAVAT